jgi:uncharacterized protein YdbL (DUF1318 family)
MKTSKSMGVLLGACVLGLVACVTINVYFPEAEIKDLSKKIEEQVREEAAKDSSEESEPSEDTTHEEPQPSSSGLLDALLGATPAYAQSVPDPEISNPAVRKIIESRASRLQQVNEYKSLGVIGENNEALLEVRSLDSLSDLKARADVQKLVRAENADREQLFKEIAAAKNVDASQIPQIRTTYASTLREATRRGDWIQMPDGSWKQK